MSKLTEEIQVVKDQILLLGKAAQENADQGNHVTAHYCREESVRLTVKLRELFIRQRETEPVALEDDPIVSAYLAEMGMARA